MFNFFMTIATQALTFLPLAFAISISYHILRATDMTIDGSFVTGAAVFARLVTLGLPPIYAGLFALLSGACAGVLVALIQRGGKVDSLLAGVLATFILSSLNLIIMDKPNINLLNQHTLVSFAFNLNETIGWITTAAYIIFICGIAFCLVKSTFGLHLRALGDNPNLFKRIGKNVELYRMGGFALTNLLAAASGCFTAQTVGYADIGMGFGMTLTGIGAIIIGQQCLRHFFKKSFFRIGLEFISCLVGVILYFFALNALLNLDINPIYLKMILGLLLIVFLRMAVNKKTVGGVA